MPGPSRGGRPQASPSDTATEAPVARAQWPPGVPHPASVRRSDATAVARATVITMSAIDATTDDPGTFERDARLRALPYLSGAYAARIRAAGHRPAPMDVWRTWVAHRAYLQVRLAPAGVDGRPSDSATAAYRAWRVTVRPIGRDGWKAPPTSTVFAFVTLARPGPGAPWQVTECSLQS